MLTCTVFRRVSQYLHTHTHKYTGLGKSPCSFHYFKTPTPHPSPPLGISAIKPWFTGWLNSHFRWICCLRKQCREDKFPSAREYVSLNGGTRGVETSNVCLSLPPLKEMAVMSLSRWSHQLCGPHITPYLEGMFDTWWWHLVNDCQSNPSCAGTVYMYTVIMCPCRHSTHTGSICSTTQGADTSHDPS